MSLNAVVTGGAGFIGSHLVDRLVGQGYCVSVVDNLSTGKIENVSSNAKLIEGDIRDLEFLQRVIGGADIVYHLAAVVSVKECIIRWQESTAINYIGTINVLQSAQRCGNIPVVYASSAAIYGDQSGSVFREDSIPHPISPYGADKLGNEHQARSCLVTHGLSSVGLRFFNVYGPRQCPSSPYAGVVSKFLENAKAGRSHTVFGNGSQSRDFIYVSDVVDCLVAAGNRVRSFKEASVFNVCTGKRVDLLRLAAIVDKICGRETTSIDHAAPREGDILHSCGSTDLAETELGFVASTELLTGIDEVWRSWS